MAFCGKCGSNIEPGDTFCSSCGTKTVSNYTPQTNTGMSYPNQNSYGNQKSSAKMALYFSGALAVLAIIALLMGDILGLIISGALVAGVHFGAYKPLQSGKTESAATVCIICAGIAAAIGLMVLMKGNGLIGILDIAASVPGFMAWQSIKKGTIF